MLSRPTAPEQLASLSGVLYFTREREAIRLARRRNLPREKWTADPILARYKFTNIRRRDDRVSRWVIEHIIKPNEQRQDLWFVLLIARLINWPPTLQHLIDDGTLFRAAADFEPEAFSASVERLRCAGHKTYSGAYMLYPTKIEPGGVKSLSVARHIIAPALSLAGEIRAALEAEHPRVADFVERLARSFGISAFMAGQVAADLTYCAQLGRAVDLQTWAPIGPGSSRGLNYLHKRSPFASWEQAAFNTALIAINDRIQRELQIADLTLHDVQNVMCEYSKYCRAALGEGKPKTIYQPEKEF